MYERRSGPIRNDEPSSGRQVTTRVKWFNATKGFGFVTPTDGGQDAFLPMAILRRAGYEDVSEGATLTWEAWAWVWSSSRSMTPTITVSPTWKNRVANTPAPLASVRRSS